MSGQTVREWSKEETEGRSAKFISGLGFDCCAAELYNLKTLSCMFACSDSGL